MVRTVIVALSSRGYCRTLSVRTACNPARTIKRLTTMASTGRRRKISVSFTSAVFRPRAQAWLRLLEAVVDDDGRTVAQLEGAGADHELAGLESVADRHEVSARLAEAHELLAR